MKKKEKSPGGIDLIPHLANQQTDLLSNHRAGSLFFCKMENKQNQKTARGSDATLYPATSLCPLL